MRRLTQAGLAILYSFAFLLTGCSGGDGSLLPTDAGRWWYYQTRSVVLGEANDQRLLIANLKRDEHQLLQRRQASWDHLLQFTGKGLQHQQYYDRGEGMGALREAHALVLPADPKTGEQWEFPSTLRLIESRTFAAEDKLAHRPLPVRLNATVAAMDETVRVPAGRYRHCLRVDVVGETEIPTDRGASKALVKVKQQEWYAPGVGLVRLTRQENSDSQFLQKGEYTQELMQTGS